MNIKQYTMLLLMAVFSLGLVAKPNNGPVVESGDNYYKQFNFKRAAGFYEKALKRNKENSYLLQRLGDCYRLLNNWSAAEPFYAKLNALNDRTPLNKLYYAEALRAVKKYDEAKTFYETYLSYVPTDSSVKARIKGLAEIQDLEKDNGAYTVNNLKDINSAFSDFGVAMHDDNEIYFSSNRKSDVFVRRTDNWTNASFLEIYMADVKDSTGTVKNSKVIESSTINKQYHESSPCYNERYNELYFDRSSYNGKRVFPSADKTVKLKIFKAGWSADSKRWDGGVLEAVEFNSKEYSVCHPAMTSTGDTLYFTSDMPGGYGRADIYMATRTQNSAWSTPRNLGPGINSSGDDMFPFIADDGVLYFASNGHLGLGGLDIFSSYKQGAGWSAPQNLRAPINSTEDDFGYVIKRDNKTGYFSSNRKGGAGEDDIYSFVRQSTIANGVAFHAYTGEMLQDVKVVSNPKAETSNLQTDKNGSFSCKVVPGTDYLFTASKEGFHPATAKLNASAPGLVKIPMYPLGDIQLEVTVQDKKTHLPIDSAEVRITNSVSGKVETCYTDKQGKCTFALDTNSKYVIVTSKETGVTNEKYLAQTLETSTAGVYPPKMIKQLVELEKAKIGVAIKLENIYYDLDKWDIRPDAAVELNKLVKILKDNPGIEIELGSHTDCRATTTYNLVLSSKRAASAVDYISTQGISMSRMVSAGYGEGVLVNKCRCEGKVIVPCTDEQHQENRRTEFKVTKF